MTINQPDQVRAQYATADHLSTRIAFQHKYSCNPLGFGPWINQQYALRPGMRMLELGCGTGSMWVGVELPVDCLLTLTDFSPGMLASAKKNLSGRTGITFQQVDAQSIPFPCGSFDVVIANMMLYHIPDLPRALSEIRRVLKSGGTFYCATFGEHGAVETIWQWLDVKMQRSYPFSLQNGTEKLRPFFSHIDMRLYPDEFHVTSLEDLIDYLLSLTSMAALSAIPRGQLRDCLASHMESGMIRLPKEYGLFICR